MDKEDKENIDTKAIEEKALLSVKYFVVDRKISHNIYQKTTKSLLGMGTFIFTKNQRKLRKILLAEYPFKSKVLKSINS